MQPLIPLHGSSQIAAYAYDSVQRTLSLQFHRGSFRYDYTNVPPEVIEGFLEAESKGRYFGAHIKGQFDCTRIDTAAGDDAVPEPSVQAGFARLTTLLVLLLASLLFAAAARADNTVTLGSVPLLRGNTTLFTHPDVAACIEDTRTRVITAQTTYDCKLRITAVPSVAPPPPPPASPPPPTGAVTYSTTFDLTEFPISEGGKWGKANNPWKPVLTQSGYASASAVNGGYDDSYALLSGFGPDQTVEAVIQLNGGAVGETHEAELLLRVTDDTNNARGIEALFSRDGGVQVVRWNGPYGSFTVLNESACMPSGSWTPKTALKTGDVAKARMIGNKIEAWINGVLKACTTDSTVTSGQPGMAFFVRAGGATNLLTFTSFSAASN